MKKLWLVFVLLIFAGPVWAEYMEQPDRGGCDDRPVDLSSPQAFQRSMEWSLWTFRSSVWNGYIDFQGNGRYWTHWGYGRWTVDNEGQVHLVNEYDPFRHDFVIGTEGRNFSGRRSDGVPVNGRLICRKYFSDIEIGDSDEERVIYSYYKDILGREPDPEGFRYWLNQFRQGTSLEEIKKGFYGSSEYRSKQVDGRLNDYRSIE